MIHSFLLVGQSNMAGRGFRDEVEPIQNKRIRVLRNGMWRDMYVPVNCDRAFSGVNLAESFADAFSQAYDTDVGLIPCADGGTTLDQWKVGGLLYDHAVMQARLAARTSQLTAILWHQGESDCREELYPHYREKLEVILQGFRRDLDAPDLPILVGGLGDYLAECTYGDSYKNYHFINDALRTLAAEGRNIGFVPADGLTSNPDHLHFNSASLRTFGLRYFRVLQTLTLPSGQQKVDTDAAREIASGIEQL